MIKIERSLIMSIAECNVSHNETKCEDNIVLNRENKCQKHKCQKTCMCFTFLLSLKKFIHFATFITKCEQMQSNPTHFNSNYIIMILAFPYTVYIMNLI